MKKFEYKITWKELPFFVLVNLIWKEEYINEMSEKGWELNHSIIVDKYELFYFKREVIPTT